MNDTTARCKFHPVGQGLFYSAILRNGDKTFSMVYDCGSMTKTSRKKSEINDLVSQLDQSETGTKKCLNVLVISHFHEDHINMIPALLKEVDVETVIMPYCCVEERLIYAIRVNKRNLKNNSNFLERFYENPVDYFNENNVKRIIVLSEEEGNIEGFERITIEDNDTIDYQRLRYEIGLKYISLYRNKTIKLGLNNNLKWCFNFSMTKEISQEELEKLKKGIREIIRGKSLSQAIGDKKLLREIKEKYKEPIKNNLNLHSIICLHFPQLIENNIFIQTRDWIIKEKNGNSHCRLWCRRNMKSKSTLLTGDEGIKRLEWYDIIKKIDMRENCYPLIFSIPHHGGSTSEIFGIYNIVSYGTKNKYNHPKLDVINQILDCSCSKVSFVNEQTDGFEYIIECKG